MGNTVSAAELTASQLINPVKTDRSGISHGSKQHLSPMKGEIPPECPMHQQKAEVQERCPINSEPEDSEELNESNEMADQSNDHYLAIDSNNNETVKELTDYEHSDEDENNYLQTIEDEMGACKLGHRCCERVEDEDKEIDINLQNDVDLPLIENDNQLVRVINYEGEQKPIDDLHFEIDNCKESESSEEKLSVAMSGDLIENIMGGM